MKRAFVFPGQGSQAVGMGKALAEASRAARDVFESVDDALNQNLSRLMWEGPDEQLMLTENAQPALMATSLAVMAVLEKDGNLDIQKAAAFVAGHSLGEYSALAAAEALDVESTAKLLRLRGLVMQKSVPVGVGAMAALLGLEFEAAARIAAEVAGGEICAAANDNAPGQVVLSGHAAAVDRAIEAAKAAGAKRAIRLQVSAPFHCALMQPAADAMAEALAETRLQSPVVPLIANVTARPTSSADEIRDLLVRQVTGTVRWRECVMAMAAAEVEAVVEIGAGNVLTGLVKRIDKSLAASACGTPQEIEALLKSL